MIAKNTVSSLNIYMKILITGGHLSPALAVIEEIGNQADLVFVGRKYILDQDKNLSLEYQEITRRGLTFYHLQTGRFTRLLNLRLFLNLFKIPLGLLQAIVILNKEKPDLILSFGGYIGFPICLIAYILGIPIFIHEQTIYPGLVNRLTGFFAQNIFIAFAESKKYFPSAKVILSGNPVRKAVLRPSKKPFNLQKSLPVLYFTGGSLGSHSLNQHLETILPELLTKYIVIHQAGRVSEYNDYQRLLLKRSKLNKILKARYYLRDHFFSDELGYIYSFTDLIVSRSGANTLFELIAWKKPAILIPLPWSGGQEQLKQAQLLQKAGVAEIFQQTQATKILAKLIAKVIAQLNFYQKNFKNVELLYQQNAAKTIVQKILA